MKHLSFVITETAHRHPERIAVSDACLRLSYRDLENRADRIARRLVERGLEPEGRVAIFGDNSVSFALLVLATFKAGGVVVPLNTRSSAEDLRRLLDLADPQAIFCDRDFAPALEFAGGSYPVSYYDKREGPLALSAGEEPDADLPPADPEAPAMLMFTSGSTGSPKGVLTSHRNYFHLLDQHVELLGLTGDDRLQLAMPLFHNAGMAGVLCSGLRAGAQVCCFTGSFKPGPVLESLRRNNISVAHWIPTMLFRVVEALEQDPVELPSLRAIHFGSMPVSAALLSRMRAVLPVDLIQLYGSTDCGLIAVSDDLRDPSHEGYMRLVESSGVRITGADGKDVGAGDVGEISVSQNDSGMLGYWNDRTRSGEAIRGGRIFTGDLARNLGQGRMELLGRRDGLIISGGENLYPDQIENVLSDHPALKEVVVVGVPDPEFGQRVCAVASLNNGCKVSVDDLRQHCAGRLPGFMFPRQICIVPELPRTPVGKIARSQVQHLAEQSPSAKSSG